MKGLIFASAVKVNLFILTLIFLQAFDEEVFFSLEPGTDTLSVQAMPYKRQRRLQDMFAAPARPKEAPDAASMGPGAAGATAAEPVAARAVANAATVAPSATMDPPAKRRKPGQQGITAFFNPKQ